MSVNVQHLNPDGLHHNPGFSQVVSVSGAVRTVYIGGQNGVDSNGQIVSKGDLKAQTEQIFRNLGLALRDAGAQLEHIIKWRIYVVQGQDIRDGFGVFQQVWGQRPNPPLITVLVVAGLANPDFLIELEAVAIIPE